MQCDNLVPFLLIGVADFQPKMTVSLARVVSTLLIVSSFFFKMTSYLIYCGGSKNVH